LLPIHGKRVQIEVLNTDKLEREIQELKTEIESLKKNDSSSSEFQEKQQKLERLERTCRCRFYDGANQKIELVELAELGSIKSGKILHGVIVTKKSGDSSRRRKFFKLEERYDSEKELYEDTYHIL
jgi:chromosome segregation ATPase